MNSSPFLPARPLHRHVLALALLALGGLPAMAQDYPSKPIKLVIPFPAGGSSDGIGRQIADKLGGILKQSVVVENKGGAGGMIGADAVAKSAPDGYTLVLVDVFHTSTPIYTRKMPYDAVKDFTPVSLIGRSPAFLVASPGVRAQDRPRHHRLRQGQPGQADHGDCRHRQRGGGPVQGAHRHPVRQRALPRQSPALVDLMSGQVNVMITTMASAGTNVKAGKLRALAATGSKRNADFPDVPTFRRAGHQRHGLRAVVRRPGPGQHAQAGGGQAGRRHGPGAAHARRARAPGQHGAGTSPARARRDEAQGRRRRRSAGRSWPQELDIKPLD
jgi:tripartite-type tricarboxylate transporter receptor subunit TctC